MPGLEWVERAGEPALLIRLDPDWLSKSAPGSDWASVLPVYPAELFAPLEDRSDPAIVPSLVQPTAGEYAAAPPDAVVFTPRFPFLPGVEYAVVLGAGSVLRLRRPAPSLVPVTTVSEIHPALGRVPRNLLRVYIEFSGTMSEGDAARCVSLRSARTGETLEDALLPPEPELWDPGRRRLTVLFDPARIKRGLVPHEQRGYPLVEGEPFELLVDASFSDGAGRPLVSPGYRRYDVGPDLRGRVDPSGWDVSAPPAGVPTPLLVAFGRPLDAALLARCLTLVGPDGHRVPGRTEPELGGMRWRFLPEHPWSSGAYRLVVDPVLEDVAGNSVRRVFDRDLDAPDQRPGASAPAEVAFAIA